MDSEVEAAASAALEVDLHGFSKGDGTYVSRDEIQRRLQEQAVIEGELEVNEALIAEREEAMREINKQLMEVREIFSDLAVMIDDQNEGIETIANNVDSSHDAAARGLKELEKANELQRGRCIVA